jgi:HAD superfamily hydrolase (TIGR01456 family)
MWNPRANIPPRYGFTNVVTPTDILMAYPSIWPFSLAVDFTAVQGHRPLPTNVDHTNPSKSLKIDAVFVFNDPRDWALDLQIILDLLLSKDGVLGTVSEKNGDPSLPNNGWQQDGQPKLFFSNPDLFWATNHHMPRLGQGGFQASLRGIWAEMTGGAELLRTVIGKPYPETYKYAERVLNKHRVQMLGGNGEVKKKVSRLERVFMVGDNPESDIRGANEFESPHGTEWTSVLVKTGVYSEGSKPKYAPKVIVKDALEAVKWALREEGWSGVVD